MYDASLKEAYLAKLKGDAAILEADHAGALEAYAAAVAATPAASSSSPASPSCRRISGVGLLQVVRIALRYVADVWRDDYGVRVRELREGACSSLTARAMRTRTLSGMWEHTEDGSGGSFAITMSENGRKFAGTLTEDADGEAKEWTGMRKSSGRGAGRMRGEKPSKRFEWLHELLLAKSTAALSSGDAAGAVEDATLATALCCQTASGWEALAAAREAAGDDEGAQAAREEADWLKSYA